MNPEIEIAVIEALAVVYRRLTWICDIPKNEKKRLYGTLCSMSAGVDPAYLVDNFPPGLPPATAIFEMYRRAAMSGERP